MILKKNAQKIFCIFLILHLILWTLIPTISNVNLPLDTIEALAWGSNLEWGYSKHPPLSAFFVEVVYKIFGNSDWAYYLLSQIFILISFVAIFKLSDEFFNNKIFALISILLLEGVFFYNFTSPEFNVNISQLPFWAWSLYFAWRCISFNSSKDFFILGVLFSLGILSKYLFIYLITGIVLLFFYYLIKSKKISFLNILITGLVTLLLILPHLIWLFENSFITILYGLKRTGGAGELNDHLVYPILFLVKQIGVLLPLILMSFFLFKKFKLNISSTNKKIIFLSFTVIVPIILMFLTSVIIGAKIRTMWMTPYYLAMGILVIELFKSTINSKKIKNFYISFLFFFLISPALYLTISIIDDTKRTDYPGKEISRLVQNKWDDNFTNEIKIVIGDEWYAGNLSYHLSSRPNWLNELKEKDMDIQNNQGVIYTGNPKILKKICPGVFGTIKPVGYCMIGTR